MSNLPNLVDSTKYKKLQNIKPQKFKEKMLSGPLDTLNENQVVSKFLVDSNQAVQFKLVRKVEDLSNDETTFSPGMSHQIFGPKVSKV